MVLIMVVPLGESLWILAGSSDRGARPNNCQWSCEMSQSSEQEIMAVIGEGRTLANGHCGHVVAPGWSESGRQDLEDGCWGRSMVEHTSMGR